MRPGRFFPFFALLLLSGCASQSPEDDGTPTIRIEGRAYDPASLQVPAGATVRVANADDEPHTVTGSGFDTRDVKAGATGSFVAPATAGRHPFTCAYHPEMTGVLEVPAG